MKPRLIFLCLLGSAIALSVNSKPHVKHHPPPKDTQNSQEKNLDSLESSSLVLPTFLPFEASSQEQGEEDVSYEDDKEGSDRGEGAVFETMEGGKGSSPVLLSEEALAQLLQESEEEVQEAEDGEDEDESEEAGEEEQEEEVKEVEESTEEEEDLEEEQEDEKDEERGEGVEEQEEEAQKEAEQAQKEEEEEEMTSSTESEIPVDLDYAADSDATEPLPTKLEEAKVPTNDAEPTEKENEEQEEQAEDVLPAAVEDYDSQQLQQSTKDPTEAKEGAVQDLPTKDPQNKSSYSTEDDEKATKIPEERSEADPQVTGNDMDGPTALSAGEEGEKEKNGSGKKGKGRKQRKNQRMRKVQGDEPRVDQVPEEHVQVEEKEPAAIDNTVHKPKRKKFGKWGPLVGMNPVQVRATVELFPSTKPPSRPSGQKAPADPCESFRCKRGKTCKLDEDNKPGCVCQEPSSCSPSVTEFDFVCGTDNKTYDTSCQLFATKCALEGTKAGHRLHLDYTGPCKLLAPCLDTELAQFPLRMRDWLKNVLLQLYEHDSMAPGFLTPKQRARVQKIYESERRLYAGDHPIELLAQDFEKNYNMYIYPVHWQFAQMDQHPSDRVLTHSEVAPLRIPLVPMEHCTSRFFQECDADKDKLVSLQEWCRCFGIKDEDMDTKLLF